MSSVASGPSAVTVRVPAKVNLQLAVGPVRADGYHGVVTVYQAIALFDEVTVRPAAQRTKIVVTGEDAASVPTGATNLASKAVTRPGPGHRPARARAATVQIEIRKRIPVAAGLAGGSADAAAALVACNELWRTGLSQSELGAVGARLGSDVPFALMGGHRGGPRPRRAADRRPGRRDLPLGAGLRGRRAVDARGLRGLRPAPRVRRRAGAAARAQRPADDRAAVTATRRRWAAIW